MAAPSNPVPLPEAVYPDGIKALKQSTSDAIPEP
jgi:hypothetical protein